MNNDDFKFIVNKLDKIDSRLDGQSETLIRNTISLEGHIKRTDLLEVSINQHKEDIAKQLKPLKRAYNLGAAGVIIIGGLVSAIKLARDLGLF